MTLIRRVLIGFTRNLSKNILLFLVIFAVSVPVFGIMMLRQALIHSENHLLNQLPPLAGVFPINEYVNVWTGQRNENETNLSVDLLKK